MNSHNLLALCYENPSKNGFLFQSYAQLTNFRLHAENAHGVSWLVTFSCLFLHIGLLQAHGALGFQRPRGFCACHEREVCNSRYFTFKPSHSQQYPQCQWVLTLLRLLRRDVRTAAWANAGGSNRLGCSFARSLWSLNSLFSVSPHRSTTLSRAFTRARQTSPTGGELHSIGLLMFFSKRKTCTLSLGLSATTARGAWALTLPSRRHLQTSATMRQEKELSCDDYQRRGALRSHEATVRQFVADNASDEEGKVICAFQKNVLNDTLPSNWHIELLEAIERGLSWPSITLKGYLATIFTIRLIYCVT